MIKIFVKILLVLGSANLIAQPNFTAIITDPQIGIEENADKLIEVVNDINSRDSISLVIVMGNITANGKFDEFLWAQEILDGLNPPYNVIGGEKDYTLSEGKGNEIALLWGDDKFSNESDLSVHYGITSIIPKYNHKDYLDIETRIFLRKNFSNNALKTTLIYSYNKIDTETLSEILTSADRVIFIVSFKKDGNNKGIIYAGSSLNNSDKWIYDLIQIKKDSVTISEASQLLVKPVEQFDLKTVPPLQLKLIDPILNVGENIKPELITIGNATIFSPPVIENNKIYTSYKNGEIICIDTDGNEKWQYETNSSIYSSPLVEGDLVVTATNEGDLFTINKNTGNVFQVIGIGESITSDIALTELEYEGMQTKGIVFGTAEGNFYCYELYSLQLVWWNQSAKKRIYSSVVTSEGKILFQDKDGTLFCLSSSNGALLWKWKADTKNNNPLFKSDLVVINHTVYFVDFDGDLHCIDALLGTKKWSIRKLNASGKIVVNENMNEVILHSENNKILRISLIAGKIIKEFDLPSSVENEIAVDILMINDTMYAGFTDGSVYDLNKEFETIFSGNAPVISLNEINGNLLVTDYDGNLTLLDLQKEKK